MYPSDSCTPVAQLQVHTKIKVCGGEDRQLGCLEEGM